MAAPPPPSGATAPLALAAGLAGGQEGSGGVTLLRFEFVPATVAGSGVARLDVCEATGEVRGGGAREGYRRRRPSLLARSGCPASLAHAPLRPFPSLQYTLDRPATAGPPHRFAGVAPPRRSRAGDASAGPDASSADVECVAVYERGRWTLHAVDAAVTLRVQKGGGGGGSAARRARPPAPAAAGGGGNDSDSSLEAELEAALADKGDRAAGADLSPRSARRAARAALPPAAELNELEREFLGRAG